MKTILTTVLLLIASLAWSQDQTAAIEHMDMNILYRGYKNKIMIASHSEKGSTYTLSGSNVSISREGDHFIAKPGGGKMAYLTVSERKEDGSVQVIRKKEYRISNLPDPQLYWGLTSSGRAVENQQPVLSAGYVEYCPFDLKFTVTSWKAEHNGITYSGDSTDITPLNALIKTFTELTELAIVANVQAPDGITRQLGGTWFIRPSAKE